jgi:WD40 repeat protein
MLRTISRCFTALLAVAAVAVCTVTTMAAPPDTKSDKSIPGATLIRNFKGEVYRVPVLLETQKGPQLLVWNDKFDPLTPSRFPGEPLKDPVFDLSFWDVKTDKESHKLAYPKQSAPLSPIPAGMASPGLFGPVKQMALSPDGKLFAHVSTTYRPVPGKINHEATGTIKLFDFESGKAKSPVAIEWKRENSKYNFPNVLFAPDGALVILMEATCTVQEPGKDKPRKTFDLVRVPKFQDHTEAYAVRDAVLSPNASLLAVAADGAVTVYDVEAGKTLFEAARAAPDAGGVSANNDARVSLAFAPGKDEQKLLAVEIVTGPPKSFVLARLLDVKDKKEINRFTLAEEETKAAAFGGAIAPDWGRAYAYFTPKGEPRILFDGKLIDASSGKKLSEFDPGTGLILSSDGKYLVRLKGKANDRKMGLELWSMDNEK